MEQNQFESQTSPYADKANVPKIIKATITKSEDDPELILIYDGFDAPNSPEQITLSPQIPGMPNLSIEMSQDCKVARYILNIESGGRLFFHPDGYELSIKLTSTLSSKAEVLIPPEFQAPIMGSFRFQFGNKIGRYINGHTNPGTVDTVSITAADHSGIFWELVPKAESKAYFLKCMGNMPRHKHRFLTFERNSPHKLLLKELPKTAWEISLDKSNASKVSIKCMENGKYLHCDPKTKKLIFNEKSSKDWIFTMVPF